MQPAAADPSLACWRCVPRFTVFTETARFEPQYVSRSAAPTLPEVVTACGFEPARIATTSLKPSPGPNTIVLMPAAMLTLPENATATEPVEISAPVRIFENVAPSQKVPVWLSFRVQPVGR